MDAASRATSVAATSVYTHTLNGSDLEDSLDLTPSPDQKKQRRSAASRRPHVKHDASKRRPIPAGGGRSNSMPGQLRGMVRPPSLDASRVAQLDEHTQYTPVDGSPDARLLNLERQANYDHSYLMNVRSTVNEIIDFMRLNEERTKEGVQLGIQMRRELYAVRDGIPGALDLKFKEMTDAMPEQIRQISDHVIVPVIEQRIDQVSKAIVELQTRTAHLDDRNKHLEHYMEELHGQRPQEGRKVVQTFLEMGQEVLSVKEMVKNLEAKTNVVRGPPIDHGATLSQENIRQLNVMYQKTEALDVIYAGYDNMVGRVNAAYDLAEKANSIQTNLVGRLDAMEVHLMVSATDGPQCGRCNAGGGSAAMPPPAPGLPGSSGGGDDIRQKIAAITSGNDICHCTHVTTLIGKVATLEARARAGGEAHDPLLNTGWQPLGGTAPSTEPSRPAPTTALGPGMVEARSKRKALPLVLTGPLGGITRTDRNLFDDKVMTTEEYKFNGVRGGEAWKNKVERYFISKAPILKEILEWVECEDMEPITPERFKLAAEHKLDDEQRAMVNAAIWGFLAGVISGSAEKIFKRAEMLNGLEAWRRMVRHIDHGRPIRLENLRREVKVLHMRPIRDLEHVEEGVAEFENTIHEYVQAGGTPYQDPEMKTDLLAIPPAKIRESLLYHSQDENNSFEKFRDIVLAQTQKILQLQNPKGLNLNVVDDPKDIMEEPGEIDMNSISSMEDLVAMVKRFHGQNRTRVARRDDRRREGGGQQDQRRPGGVGQPGGQRDRRPRRCPNCGQEHESLKCPKPPVAIADRKCWSCNKAGHTSARCPEKRASAGAIRTVEERTWLGDTNAIIDDEGFKKVVHGGRPRPR